MESSLLEKYFIQHRVIVNYYNVFHLVLDIINLIYNYILSLQKNFYKSSSNHCTIYNKILEFFLGIDLHYIVHF